MNKIRLVFAFVLLASATFLLMPTAGQSTTAGSTLTLDVASDGRTFAINSVHPGAGTISRGDTFVITGKIFAGNTIPTGGTKQSPNPIGPDSPGSIGAWYSRGT